MYVQYVLSAFIHMSVLCVFGVLQDLPFTLAVTKLKGYFEVFFEQPPPFKVSLVETESDQTVWSATIREGTYTPAVCLSVMCCGLRSRILIYLPLR